MSIPQPSAHSPPAFSSNKALPEQPEPAPAMPAVLASSPSSGQASGRADGGALRLESVAVVHESVGSAATDSRHAAGREATSSAFPEPEGSRNDQGQAMPSKSAPCGPEGRPLSTGPRCRRIFCSELGDPVSCLCLGPSGCMAGTMLGRVWLVCPETSGQPEQLAAFSDEGVRGLFLDEESGFATFADNCRGWRRLAGHPQAGSLCFRSLDRKTVQSVRHVLQRDSRACVLFPLSSAILNVDRREHHPCAFKLLDLGSSTEVAPCDFDGHSLLLVDRGRGHGPPILRVVQLERNEQTEIDGVPQGLYLSLVKLWGPSCLVYVVGKVLHIYDIQVKQVVRSLHGHAEEIMAVDCQDPQTIVTLSADATVKLWNGNTGECLATLRVPQAGFFLGYPYSITMRGRSILLSADEGAFLLELEGGAVGF